MTRRRSSAKPISTSSGSARSWPSVDSAVPVGRLPRATAGFAARVCAVVRSIPPGRVATYGDVAALAGRRRAWRAVGNLMRRCADPGVPCHRVIASGGLLGGYGGHESMKRSLLAAEGVRVRGRRVVEFAAVRWTGPGARGAAP